MNIIKIVEKTTLITVLFVICYSLFCIKPSYALDVPDESVGGVTGNAELMLPSIGDEYKPTASDGKAIDIVEKILGVLTVVGIIAIVIAIAVMGFGMILGSASEKAFKQEQLVGLLIAAGLITTGSVIARMIISVAEKM